MSTRVFLIRHAETEVTLEDRFAGLRDLPLTATGREHAAGLAMRLEGLRLDAAYSSPLKRAIETAKSIAEPHGIPVLVSGDLREIDHGHWEGLTHAQVEQQFPGEYAAYQRDPLDFKPEGGESARAVTDRAVPALLQIVCAHPEQQIAIVSHKATNRLLIAYFIGIDLKRYRDKLGQRPACLNILDFTSETQVRLTLLNDVSHYEDGIPPDEKYIA